MSVGHGNVLTGQTMLLMAEGLKRAVPAIGAVPFVALFAGMGHALNGGDEFPHLPWAPFVVTDMAVGVLACNQIIEDHRGARLATQLRHRLIVGRRLALAGLEVPKSAIPDVVVAAYTEYKVRSRLIGCASSRGPAPPCRMDSFETGSPVPKSPALIARVGMGEISIPFGVDPDLLQAVVRALATC